MESLIRYTPAVFAAHDEYQIMVLVNSPCLMWVKVGNECFYDDSCGILRSETDVHRMCVPSSLLDKEKKYTVCDRKMTERLAYYSKTEDVFETEFEFRPVQDGKMNTYLIADAHNMVKPCVDAAKEFEKQYGSLDFLILGGDIPNDSSCTDNFENIYDIISFVTGGNIPTVFAKGNHDMRGICADRLEDYIPIENGVSYYSFRLGSMWGLVLDCGEDKNDDFNSYGNTICCHAFRRKQTQFIKNIIANAEKEYNAPDVKNKVVFCHVNFTMQSQEPFNIEEDLYKEWTSMLNEHIKPDIMICGHDHKQKFIDKGMWEGDLCSHAFPIVVGSAPNTQENYYAGAGFVIEKDKKTAVFIDNKGAEREKSPFKYEK